LASCKAMLTNEVPGVSDPPPDRANSVYASERTSQAARSSWPAVSGVPALRRFGPVQLPDGFLVFMMAIIVTQLDSLFFGRVKRTPYSGLATAGITIFDAEQHLKPRLDRFFLSAGSQNRNSFLKGMVQPFAVCFSERKGRRKRREATNNPAAARQYNRRYTSYLAAA